MAWEDNERLSSCKIKVKINGSLADKDGNKKKKILSVSKTLCTKDFPFFKSQERSVPRSAQEGTGNFDPALAVLSNWRKCLPYGLLQNETGVEYKKNSFCQPVVSFEQRQNPEELNYHRNFWYNVDWYSLPS